MKIISHHYIVLKLRMSATVTSVMTWLVSALIILMFCNNKYRSMWYIMLKIYFSLQVESIVTTYTVCRDYNRSV
jgi:hypothetical protein